MSLTSEHYKIAAKNGISKTTLWMRVNRNNWDIEEAISFPVGQIREVTKNKPRKSRIFTEEQRERAKLLGINPKTMYSRVASGMDPEMATSIVANNKKRVNQKYDWNNDIFALYAGDELLADGTVYEIAEKMNLPVKKVKWYSYESSKIRNKGNARELVFLGADEEDWDED